MRTFAALVLVALAASPAALAHAQGAPAVPPVMVAVLASGHVPEDVTAAVQSSLVEGVRGLAGARPVLALAQPEMRERLAACADATCQGTFLAESGAIGAVVARLSRRTTRGEIAMTLDMIDPVSGSPRVPQQSASIVDAATAPVAIAPLVEGLRASMFSPPPPDPTLLVTVNVDGAAVSIDDASVGESPIAAQRLTPGHHVLTVARAGYGSSRRELDLSPGDQERLDIVLVALEGEARAREADTSPGVAPAPGTPWYEQWYVWVGIGGGLLVVGAIIAGVVVATQPSGSPDPMGTPLPGIRF